MMIVVRFVFQAKFGTAGKVVEGFKEMADTMQRIAGPDVRARVLTDLSGPFDTVVQEIELESLAKWEDLRAKMFSDPEFQESQDSGESPFLGGRTEFYTLEGSI
jgi:hypothetical protein